MFAEIVYKSGDQYIQTAEDREAAILVFIPCFIGVVMTVIVIRGCMKIPAMNSPFGYLMKYNMFAGIIAPINMGFFYFFGIYMDIKLIIDYSRLFGQVSTTLIPILQSQYLSVSLNRFIALVFPMQYSKFYDLKFRRLYVLTCWTVPIIYTTLFSLNFNCGYKFYHYGWVFSYVISDSCGTKFESLLRGVQLLLGNLIILIDVMTLFLLVCFRKRVFTTRSADIRKREINFAQQVIIQGFVFMGYTIWYSMGYKWVPGQSEQWRIFWTSTFSANLLHIFATGVIFIFNAEFSRWLWTKSRNDVSARTVENSIRTIVSQAKY